MHCCFQLIFKCFNQEDTVTYRSFLLDILTVISGTVLSTLLQAGRQDTSVKVRYYDSLVSIPLHAIFRQLIMLVSQINPEKDAL